MDTINAEVQAAGFSACDLYYYCIQTRRDNARRDDAWCEFTQRYDGVVRRLICVAFSSGEDALMPFELEEYVQEVYLRLLATGEKNFCGTSDAEFWGYVYKTVRHLAIDRWRSFERRESCLAACTPSISRWHSAPTPSPETRAMARQSLGSFLERCRRAAAGARTEMKMRVLRLAFFDGLSSREIARRLGDEEPATTLTPCQIDAMIFRLRRRLTRLGAEIPCRRVAVYS